MENQIDVSDITNIFDLSEETFASLKKHALKSYVVAVYDNLSRLAKDRLNTSRDAYMNSVSVVQENEWAYSLRMGENTIGSMLESGMPSFDMKPGFAKSKKARRKKDGGWFLIIPFGFRTTSASPTSGRSGDILPRIIYDIARLPTNPSVQRGNQTVSRINDALIPERYQQNSVTSTSGYIPKSSIYTGLQRTLGANGKSTYNTFRVVSDKSDPQSWIHPGIKAHSLMDEALAAADRDDSVYAALDNIL